MWRFIRCGLQVRFVHGEHSIRFVAGGSRRRRLNLSSDALEILKEVTASALVNSARPILRAFVALPPIGSSYLRFEGHDEVALPWPPIGLA